MTQIRKLIIIDGSSYLFRAYHALPELSNSKHQPTGAIYGVGKMLFKLLQDHQPSHIVTVMDAKGKTIRHQLYPNYKSHRPKMDQNLVDQLKQVDELVQVMGIPLVRMTGIEADDIMATLAIQAQAKGWHCTIVSNDKDLTQLINPQIQMLDTLKNIVLDEQSVLNKYQLPPKLIADYLALVGDSVDGIPGIAKVGHKTAVKWLQTYGGLEQLIQNADKITGKVGENLRNNLDNLKLYYQLTCLDTQIALDIDLEQLTWQGLQTQALLDFCQRLEFHAWPKDFGIDNNHNNADKRVKADYQALLTWADFHHYLSQLQQSQAFAFDTETTHLDPLQAELVGLSFAIHPKQAVYIPFNHHYLDAPMQLNQTQVLQALKPLLENPDIAKIGQNLKYDQHVLANYGIALQGIGDDTMLASYVLDSTEKHDLDYLAIKHLNYTTIHYKDIVGKGKKQKSFAQVDIATASVYAAEDADISLQLQQKFRQALAQQPTLQQLYQTLEIPLIKVLFKMERQGVLIDRVALSQQSQVLSKKIQQIEQSAYHIAGEKFNLASPKQIQSILYEKLKLPILKKTPKGQPSTSEEVLHELAVNYSLPRLILEHRGFAKLKSTYMEALIKQINPKTQRVHTSYHQAVAVTGRLSSVQPNLQNIPIRTEQGRKIRQAFIAPKGYKIVAADYSQIELRIMAHLSQDTTLLQAFHNNQDIHQATAAEIFDIALEQVNAEQRRSAKAINFGLIYGMSAFGLAKQLNIDNKQAKQYIERYFQRYPQVKRFMDQTREQASKQGYVETLLGRRLYLPEINAKNTKQRQYAERTAINAPMQGTAADIIKLAMLAVDQQLSQTQTDAKMLMQVHDELVFEVAEAEVSAFSQWLKPIMEKALKLDLPLVVAIGVGDNWEEAH